MKALVLSGEAGTRLRPLMHISAERPVPVAHKTVRSHGLASIAGAGLTHVGVTVGDSAAHLREAVDTWLRDEVRDPCSGPRTSVAENRRIVDREAEPSAVPCGAPIESSPTGPCGGAFPAPCVSRAHHLVPADGSKVQIPC